MQRLQALESRLVLEQRKATDTKRQAEVQKIESVHREQELTDQAYEQMQMQKMREQESAVNKRVVRGRVASPGEVLVVVLVALVVAF